MFEESKDALLNGMKSMGSSMSNIKSPKISRHAPPFIHAVVNSSRRRKQEGAGSKNVHWIILAVLAILGILIIVTKWAF